MSRTNRARPLDWTQLWPDIQDQTFCARCRLLIQHIFFMSSSTFGAHFLRLWMDDEFQSSSCKYNYTIFGDRIPQLSEMKQDGSRKIRELAECKALSLSNLLLRVPSLKNCHFGEKDHPAGHLASMRTRQVDPFPEHLARQTLWILEQQMSSCCKVELVSVSRWRGSRSKLTLWSLYTSYIFSVSSGFSSTIIWPHHHRLTSTGSNHD